MKSAADFAPRARHWENVFPVQALEGCKTALVLFAAGFGGAQDAAFVAEAGIKATCVDVNAEALEAMSKVYPEDWEWVTGDAFDFPKTTKRTWDLTTVDVYTGAFSRAAQMVNVFCRISRKAVILGSGPNTKLRLPEGWLLAERVRRSDFKGGVYWSVLIKEPES